jgi:hypothetical protein
VVFFEPCICCHIIKNLYFFVCFYYIYLDNSVDVSRHFYLLHYDVLFVNCLYRMNVVICYVFIFE